MSISLKKKRKTVAAGQHYVQNDKVGGPTLQQRQGRGAVDDAANIKARLLESILEQLS